VGLRRPPAAARRLGVASAVLLYGAIQQGLLFRPDMQVSGNGSTDTLLRWYADRVSGDSAGRAS
jgi:hypothetical protein